MFKVFSISLALFLATAACGKKGGKNSSPPASASVGDTEIEDPLYSEAWHLENIGQSSYSLGAATPGVDIKVSELHKTKHLGSGLTIAVSDTGVETAHEDLLPNYLSGRSKNFLGQAPYDGEPVVASGSSSDAHGTSVAGIAAAVGWNGKGSRGVAPGTKFVGFNTINPNVQLSLEKILYQVSGGFDIYNYSYGSSPCIYQHMGSEVDRRAYMGAYREAAAKYRGSKGAIFVKAAGNEYVAPVSDCLTLPTWDEGYLGNSAFSEDNNYPWVMIVGAVAANGLRASYSTPGPNLWVSAPGGEFGDKQPAIVTTDLSGCSAGHSVSGNTANSFESGSSANLKCDYTSTMNGTSSATPIVSGVVALVLESNPLLTWRDVRYILASTATLVEPSANSYPHPFGLDLPGHIYQRGWTRNKAGFSFSNWYGFGLVNAEKAVAMAKSYQTNLGQLLESININDRSWSYDSGLVSLPIPDASAVGVSSLMNVKHNVVIETVQIRLSVQHDYAENLGVELTSPSGTVSTLANINSSIIDKDFEDILLSANGFYGESSLGQWKLKVVDGARTNPDGTVGSTGKILNWKLNVLGHADPLLADQTLPAPVASITHALRYGRLDMTPLISFTPSPTSSVIRYEMSLGTSQGADNIYSWFPIGTVTSGVIGQLNLKAGERYFVNVRAVDNAEHSSVVTSSSGWVVDNSAEPPILDAALQGAVLSSAQSQLTGACEESAVLTVSSSTGATIASSSCDVNGRFTITVSFPDKAAKHRISIRQTDSLGNQSSESIVSVYYMPKKVETLSLGDFHGCFIDSNSSPKCFGANSSGELGNGTLVDSSLPVAPQGLSGSVKSISAGAKHSCAVLTSGSVKCWGDNYSGQLGNGTNVDSSIPVYVSGIASDAVTVIAGSNHSCALLTSGAVKCWGYNANGALGNATTTNSSIPVQVSGLSSGVKYISASRSNHTCAMTTTGAVKCWGFNEFGQIGNASTVDQLVPVDVVGLSSLVDSIYTSGFSSCAKLTSGVFRCWGLNSAGQLGDGTKANRSSPVNVTLISGNKELSLGDFYNCGLYPDGTAKCWGYNSNNLLGINETIVDTPVQIASGLVALRSGMSFNCGLSGTNSLSCRGLRTSGQTGEGTSAFAITQGLAQKYQIKNSLQDVAKVEAGDSMGCYVTSGNRLYCFGSNAFGGLVNGHSMVGNDVGNSTPTEITSLSGSVVDVAISKASICVLTTSGGVKCWGDNSSGAVGDGTNIDRLVPTQVSGLGSGVSMLSSGKFHTCALTSIGAVKCWGDGTDGELGNGGTSPSNVPVDVNGLGSGVTHISSSGYATCAVTSSGGVKCWGYNGNGQLGDSSLSPRSSPVDVTGLSSGYSAVSVGGYHSCALSTTGAVKCWGSNRSCAVGNGSICNQDFTSPQTVTGITAGALTLTSGSEHNCALMSGGAVRCWGAGSSGQLGSGNTATSSYSEFTSAQEPFLSPASISAGGESTCMVTSAGDGYCWGSGKYGQRGDGKAETPINSSGIISSGIFN